ncbi:MAG TPA: choice-of-anchor D domain-containing protein [Terriglobia bacterium]|nr:choice-of-anchor D domain-containing protein [Terriglobia bacterium]
MQNRKQATPLAVAVLIVPVVLMLFSAANLRAAGQGGIGILSLSPTQLNFGDVLIVSATGGGPSAPQTVTVTNIGDAALSITTIASSSHLFSETDTCRTSSSGSSPSIAPGGSCTISVVFQPLVCGPTTATLTVSSDTASNSPQTFSVAGTGTGPCATLSATTLTFASQLVTTTSAPQTVTLTSSGNQSVVISSLSLQGTFNETNDCTAAPLAPGTSCTISVTFTPLQGGVTPGFVQINDNTGPVGQVISLGGTGADFSLASSPTSNTISAGASATYTITATSVGGFNQAVTLACTAPPPGVSCSFSPASVTPGASGTATATVTVATTAAGLAPGARWRPVFPMGGPGPEILLGCLLAALVALGIGARLARRQLSRGLRPMWGAIALIAAPIAVLAVAGCGGSKSTTVSTPAGTYQVLVDGSTSAGSTTVTHPALLILIVQ